jgi:hypothetical protein
MSTRCAIGTGSIEDFTAVYSHWDGYPRAKVPELFRLVNETFDGDVDKTLHYLMVEHPQGWSSLSGSGIPFNTRERKIGDEHKDVDEHYAPDEGESILTSKQVDEGNDMGIEWLYLLDSDSMQIVKVGTVGFFGMTAGENRFSVTFLPWNTDLDTVDLDVMEEKGYEDASKLATE